MFAADAGVFVAASAGNSGPTASTVAHNSPWVTTVAASTHDRDFTRTATLGDGTVLTGPGVGPAVASSPLVYSGNVGGCRAPIADLGPAVLQRRRRERRHPAGPRPGQGRRQDRRL